MSPVAGQRDDVHTFARPPLPISCDHAPVRLFSEPDEAVAAAERGQERLDVAPSDPRCMMAPQPNTAARQHARRREDLVVRARKVEGQHINMSVVGLVPFHQQSTPDEVRERRPFEAREPDI